jgi:hypothetical protein
MNTKRKKRISQYEHDKEADFKYIDHFEAASPSCLRKKITTSEYDPTWFDYWLGLNEEDNANES